MAPIGAVHYFASAAIFGKFIGHINGNGQTGLAHFVYGYGGLVGRKHSLDGKKINAALCQGLRHPSVGFPDEVIGNAEIGIAAVGFDGARRGTN